MTYDTERRYYVYGWYLKDTGEVFYIGKGTGKRYLTRKRENSYFMRMLESHDCEPRIIKDGLTEKEAFDLETELIEYHRVHSKRLTNVQDGGSAPPKHYGERPESWKKHMSEAQKKYNKEHPEARKASSERMKAFLKTDEGKKFSQKSIESRNNEAFRASQREKCVKANNTPEYKARQSALMKEKYSQPEVLEKWIGKNNPNAQAIKQYDLDGNFIKEYETMTEASRETGISVSSISAAARGEKKTGCGFKWVFATEKRIHLKKTHKGIVHPSLVKAVLQYDMNGNFLKEYPSISEAARQNGFAHRTNIMANLKGKTKSAYGFVWKYK